MCVCPKEYEGKQCEVKKRCKTNPITQNANQKCDLEKCKVTCFEGYALPDQSTEMDMICENYTDPLDNDKTYFQWKPVDPTQNFDPICKRNTPFKFISFDR